MGKDINILKGNIIHTPNMGTFEIFKQEYIIVENRLVKGIYKSIPKQYEGYNINDYGDNLIIPGLVDLHTHGPQFTLRGLGLDRELLPWLEAYPFKEEGKFKDIEYAKKVYKEIVEEIWSVGTTRVVIFATIHCESTKILMDLLEEKGIAAFVGKVNMDRNSADELMEYTDKSLEDTEKWINDCKDKYKKVKPIITPRFVPSCSEKLMDGLGKLAIKYNVPVQSHLSENKGEIEMVKTLHPNCKNYSDVYNSFSLFGQTPTVMAHCVHLEDNEIDTMVKNNVMVAHCPDSNINLISGVAPIRKLLNRGLKIGLGSDISAGSKVSIFDAMVSAIQVSKLRQALLGESERCLTIPEAFYLGTKGGGSFFGKVGSFEKGYEFDALVIDDSDLCKINKGSIEERVERLIYSGSVGKILARYVSGQYPTDAEVISGLTAK